MGSNACANWVFGSRYDGMTLDEIGIFRMVTSLVGSSPAFLIRSTSTSDGVPPLPEVTIVLPLRSVSLKLAISVLDRTNDPSPSVSADKFTKRRSGTH